MFCRLSQLEDNDHRKLDKLGRWDPDCADTVVWLRANKHRFRMEVFEPPALSVNVPDKKYAAAIESLFNANDMRVSSPFRSSVLISAGH